MDDALTVVNVMLVCVNHMQKEMEMMQDELSQRRKEVEMALAARDHATQKPVVASVSLSECNILNYYLNIWSTIIYFLMYCDTLATANVILVIVCKT